MTQATADYADVDDPIGCLIIDLAMTLNAPQDETGEKLIAAKKQLKEFMKDCYDITL